MNEHSKTTENPTQTAFSGIPGGVRLDLFDPLWFVVAGDDGGEIDAPEPTLPTETEEIASELQGKLFDARPRYACPDLDYLASLTTERSSRAYVEHPDDCGHVANLSDAQLAERIGWLHRHRSRGLSPLDLAVQREWTARALGVGYFYGRSDPTLPTQFVELAGRRAPLRRLVLAALMLAMVRGANGLCISAPEAEMLWSIPSSTWWNVIAWLESRGLLVRMRRYKNNEAGPNAAPVHLCPNWYGPGPELLARRDAILAAFGRGTDEQRHAAQQAMVGARRERRRRISSRQRERAGHTPPGAPAPGWALVVGLAAYDAKRHEQDRERARAILQGGEWTPGDPQPVVDGSELAAELERLAAADVEPGDVLDAIEAAPEAAAAAPAVELDASPVPRSGAVGAVVRGVTGGRESGAAAASGQSITVQSVDGDPAGPEFGREGAAAPDSRPPVTPRTTAPTAPERGTGDASSSTAGAVQVHPKAAAESAATPPADPWSRACWETRTVHDAPLAAWAERNAGESPPRTDVDDGGPPLALEGEPRSGPGARRPEPERSSSVRESAARKLAEALPSAPPSVRERLQAMVDAALERRRSC